MKEKEAITLKHNVALLAKNYPEVKSNYNLLISMYWMKFEGATNITDVAFCTPSESISRAFRSLVKCGAIELPPNIRKIRRKEEKDFHVIYGKERVVSGE